MHLKTPNERAAEWLDDLGRVPVHLQVQWIIETLESKDMLHVFGRYFFPLIIAGGDTPDCHIDLIAELTSPVNSAILFPRGFAKSTWEKIDTLHDIVYGLEPVILYISTTLQAASYHFQSIRSQLESNEALRHVYGNLVPERHGSESVKWTDHHFETTNGVNVVASGANKGRGVNIKDQRPTKVIVDDAETDEQVRSAMRRRYYHDWLYYVIIPSMDQARGRIKVIGTNIHQECEVLKFYNENGGIRKAAIENGQSIWPEYWSLERLDTMRKLIGTRAFNQEYMNDATSYENARMPADWIDNAIYTTLPLSRENLKKVITIDPQSGEGSEADEYAITTLAWYTTDKHRYVLNQKSGQASQLSQAKELILTWLDNKDAFVVGAEKVLNQVTTYSLVLDWKNGKLNIDGVDGTDRNIPLRAISPGGKDKVARLEAHEPMIERGELHLRPEQKKLREQLLFLGTGTLDHDDCADSCIMALDLSYKTNKSSTKAVKALAEKSPTISGNLWRQKF